MPDKRTTHQVRVEIDAEREALVREVGALRRDVAGALPYALGTALALALLTRSKTARFALRALWWLR
jgi:hypothetical protein